MSSAMHNSACWRTFAGLWPKITHTPDQVAAWEDVWRNHPTPRATAALREVYASQTDYPKPAMLAKVLRIKNASPSGSGDRAKGKSVEQTHREIAAAALPVLRDAINTMPDEEMLALYRHWCWQRAIEVYGDGAPSVVAAYWQWQAARHYAGLDSKPEQMTAEAYLAAMGGKLVQRDAHRPRVSWSRIVENYLTQPATA